MARFRGSVASHNPAVAAWRHDDAGLHMHPATDTLEVWRAVQRRSALGVRCKNRAPPPTFSRPIASYSTVRFSHTSVTADSRHKVFTAYAGPSVMLRAGLLVGSNLF